MHSAAGDAGQLLAVADVDAHRADVDAGHAVDAVARCPSHGLLAARLAPPVAVADGERVLVHHRGLDARPGAGVDADLFAREAAEEEGGAGQDQHGDIGDGMAPGRSPGRADSVGASVK